MEVRYEKLFSLLKHFNYFNPVQSGFFFTQAKLNKNKNFMLKIFFVQISIFIIIKILKQINI